jgi:hypothetical protein
MSSACLGGVPGSLDSPQDQTVRCCWKIHTSQLERAPGVPNLFGKAVTASDTDLFPCLARLLQPEAARTILRGQTAIWRISHSREVDALLVELIDQKLGTGRQCPPKRALPRPAGKTDHLVSGSTRLHAGESGLFHQWAQLVDAVP